MSELKIINTKGYNSELDQICEDGTDIFIKTKLTKRVTFGEYRFEPKNGFETDNEYYSDAINLDECEVYYLQQPTLNENQQIVLKWLKKMYQPKLKVSAMVILYGLIDDNINDNWQEYSDEIPEHIEALQKLSVAEENQVLEVFAKWAFGTGGREMKLHQLLSAEEWLVLNEYLMYGGYVFEDWDKDGTLRVKSRLLDSATEKIKQTALIAPNAVVNGLFCFWLLEQEG